PLGKRVRTDVVELGVRPERFAECGRIVEFEAVEVAFDHGPHGRSLSGRGRLGTQRGRCKREQSQGECGALHGVLGIGSNTLRRNWSDSVTMRILQPGPGQLLLQQADSGRTWV